MKRIIILSFALMLSIGAAWSAPQVIVVGHDNRYINILDIESKKVVWQYPLSKSDGEQCNSVVMLEDGEHIAFSTQISAKVVSLKSGKVVWEYRTTKPLQKEQIHSVVALKGGGFSFFIASYPSEIVEVSKSFEIVKRVELTALEGGGNAHGMFRQVALSRDGSYIMPWFPSQTINKVSRDGEVLESYKVGAAAFAVRELKNGNLLYGTGDRSEVVEWDTKSGKVVRRVDDMRQDGRVAWLQYLSQSEEIEKGKYMVANWTGHYKKHLEKTYDFLPTLMIINSKNEIEWSITEEDSADLKFISGFLYSKKGFVK